MAFTIKTVDGGNEMELQAVIKLIRAYTDWLGVDLTFQNFEHEMASMPGKYSPPRGTLLLAVASNGKPVGCVGLCPVTPNDGRAGCCEMKRLYVNPEGRGTGAGRALVEEVIRKARELGYEELLLDSLAHMKAAQALYEAHGFRSIPAYYANPHEHVIYRCLRLVP